MSFNGQVVESTTLVDATVTAATIGSDFHTVDCNSAAGVNRGVSAITAFYQDYKYRKASIEFLPFIGPASAEAAGRIYIGFIDNPEIIVTFKALTTAQKIAAVKGLPGVKSYNVWERFIYNVPLTYRRKWWNVNLTQSAPNNEETERSTQGMIVIGIETIGAAVTVGRYIMKAHTHVQGLTQVVGT
jgi:hypothetical protein